MDWIYILFIVSNFVLLVVALVANSAIMYYMMKYKRLRAMTVAYLVMMTTVVDIVMNIATVGYITEAYRNYKNILITYELCWIEQICLLLSIFLKCFIQHTGKVPLIPISKLSLFILSIDRVYAVFWPMLYRTRNHGKFAGIMLFFCLIPASVTTSIGVIKGVRIPEAMEHLCNVYQVFPKYLISMGMIITILPDIGTYFSNAFLIYKIRQPPLTASQNRDTDRQRAITRTLLISVAVHTVLSVLPILAALCVKIVARNMSLEFIDDVLYETIRNHSIRVLGQVESIVNAYVYATKLPDFRAIIHGQGKIGISRGHQSVRSQGLTPKTKMKTQTKT